MDEPTRWALNVCRFLLDTAQKYQPAHSSNWLNEDHLAHQALARPNGLLDPYPARHSSRQLQGVTQSVILVILAILVILVIPDSHHHM